VHKTIKYEVLHFGALGFITQVLVVYYTAYYNKTGKSWTEDYTVSTLYCAFSLFSAGWLALQDDFLLISSPLTDLFFAFPILTKIFTWAVVNWQHIGTFIYFSPFFTGPAKTLTAFGFFFMHFAFFITMRLEMFNWITMATTLGKLNLQ
jgi:hypothetical protein